MTNPIGSNGSSAAAKAVSVFGNARQALKSMAEAATSGPEGDTGSAAAEAVPESPAPSPVKSRQGRTLDRYA
jgi:hypothetical protein